MVERTSLRGLRMLVVTVMSASTVLAGCLRQPVDWRGTIYTPAPTAIVTVDPNEPPLEEWANLFIPKRCIRGVPRGWSGNSLLDISPSGQWIAYESTSKYNGHFSIYNLVTGEWRSPKIMFRSHEVRWDADESGLYYLGFPMGETPEDRRLWRIGLWLEVVRKCPYCVSFDVSEATSTLAVMRSIEPGRQQVDVVGWTKPFTEAVTVDVVARKSVGGISLSPGGKRLAYSSEVEPKRPDVFLATRVADLSSGAIVTLGENYMANAPG